jgi:hypothetical protein
LLAFPLDPYFPENQYSLCYLQGINRFLDLPDATSKLLGNGLLNLLTLHDKLHDLRP